jgi:hypothetical protein
MERGPAVFVILLVVAIAGFLAFDTLRARSAAPQAKTLATAPAAVDDEPVPGERLPDTLTPQRILNDFANTPPALRETEVQTYAGMYAPRRGWELRVAEVRAIADFTIIRMRVPVNLPDAQGWVEGTLENAPPALSPGDTLTFVAKIDSIEARKLDAARADSPESFHLMISDIRVLQIVPAASAVPKDPAASDDNRPPT